MTFPWGRLWLLLGMIVVVLARPAANEAPTPPAVALLSSVSTTTTLPPTPAFPTVSMDEVYAALDADPEWGQRQRQQMADLFCQQRPERCNPPTTTTTSAPPPTTTTVTAVSVVTTPSAPGRIAWRPSVERWRGMVAVYFDPADVEHALAIIRCESVGDPDAYNPGGPVSGLFQHRDRYWASRSAAAGWAGASIFNPEANIAVAAWLVYHNGGWKHWSGRAWGVDSCEEYAVAQGVG